MGSALLGGVVRKEDGVPMSHAFIPVLGDDGRQLLTTRTDDQGRCVAADLPEELAVVGHLPAHLDGSGADLGSAAA